MRRRYEDRAPEHGPGIAPVSASGAATPAARRLSVRLVARAENTAMARAVPICWEVFIKPAARPVALTPRTLLAPLWHDLVVFDASDRSVPSRPERDGWPDVS